MAEAAKRNSGEESTRRKGQWKETAAQIAMMVATGIISGASLAAGGHAYTALARKLGGQPGGAVVPLRKVV